MLKKLFLAVIFGVIYPYCKVVAQLPSFKTAFEMPTRVVYDLMVDKRGFLWIASDEGVSKFDGINLIHFKSAEQSSLPATGLCEDNNDRIWFSNFTGQIFYIENQAVHLLKNYNYRSDRGSPKLTLLGNQLIATSHNGLFVMDLKTFKSKHLTLAGTPAANTYTLAKMKTSVLIYGQSGFYRYSKSGQLKKMKSKLNDASLAADISILNTATRNDTAYQHFNPSGLVKALVVRNDSVIVVKTRKFNNYINSVTIEGDNQWVNTTKVSYLLNNSHKFSDLNISDIVADKEGNNWISTLNNGVFVSYHKNRLITDMKPAGLDSNDVLTSFFEKEETFYWGTQRGALIQFDPQRRSLIKKTIFNPNLGPITALAVDDRKNIFVAFSPKLIALKSNGERIDLPVRNTTQILPALGYTFVASDSGLIAIPDSPAEAELNKFQSLFGTDAQYDPAKGWFRFDILCREICFDNQSQSIVLASNKGLHFINKKGLQPIYFRKKPVYTTSICYLHGKLYAGTLNNGLLVFDKTGINQLTVSEGLLSDNILKIRPGTDHLWIIGSGPLQLFDLENNGFENYDGLPSRKDAHITDVYEDGKVAYLMTLNGLLIYPLNKQTKPSLPLAPLLDIKNNNKYSLSVRNGKFSYWQNNLSFKLEVPNYYYAKDIYIKYRLLNSADTTWKVTETGGRQIDFPSLPPGNYIFNAIAVNPKANLNAKMVTYSFLIAPPWWKRTWVRFFVAIIIFAVVNYIVISYHFRQIAYQRAFHEEQESVRLERQRISSEIHDDIGSGLFAIHLYAGRAKKKLPHISEINDLSDMVNGIAEKIRDIIWSTNTENDNLENLIYYIQFQVEKMFENSTMHLMSAIPNNIPDANINSQARRDIYLVMKELAHNAIKHSQAKKVEMRVEIDNEYLSMLMSDDGVGFEKEKTLVNSMGLENVHTRINRWKGTLTIDQRNKGTAVAIQIPLKQMTTLKLTDILKKWQISVFEILRGFRKRT